MSYTFLDGHFVPVGMSTFGLVSLQTSSQINHLLDILFRCLNQNSVLISIKITPQVESDCTSSLQLEFVIFLKKINYASWLSRNNNQIVHIHPNIFIPITYFPLPNII